MDGCGTQILSEYVIVDIPMLLRASRTQRLMPLPVPTAARWFVLDGPEVPGRAVSQPVEEEEISATSQ
jgi:hypothetical protein